MWSQSHICGGGATGSDRVRTSNRKSPEVTLPEVTESDRVRMRNRYILYYYYSSSDTEGVPSGVRMRNRKLSVPALFSCILTGNDVTRRSSLATGSQLSRPFFGGVFFIFHFFFKYGKIKSFYSVTQVTLDFKRCGLKKYGGKAAVLSQMFTLMCDIFIICFVLFLFFVFWVKFQRYCCCCCSGVSVYGCCCCWCWWRRRRRSLWVLHLTQKSSIFSI